MGGPLDLPGQLPARPDGRGHRQTGQARRLLQRVAGRRPRRARSRHHGRGPAPLRLRAVPDCSTARASRRPIVSGAAALVWTVRSDLDNTQLFDLLRFSAHDIGTRGFDPETGYGMLDIPAALARHEPVRDAGEPNDDVRLVKPGGLFASGSPPLTSRAKAKASLRATLDVDRGSFGSVPALGARRPQRDGERAEHTRRPGPGLGAEDAERSRRPAPRQSATSPRRARRAQRS